MDNRNINSFVGARIKARRIQLGLGQSKVGEVLGLTFQQVQKYEKGKDHINVEKLFKLSKFFNVSILYFFSGFEAYADIKDEDLTANLKKSKKMNKDICLLIEMFGRIEEVKIRKMILDLVKRLV